MNSFSSKTQYHQDFGLKGNNNVCSFFSLYFANMWLKTKTVNEETYLNALTKAVDLFKILDLKEIDFNALLAFSNGYTEKDVNVTMVDFIKEDLTILDNLFKLDNSKCLIFLKHEKFFVVICDKENNKWHILDCHIAQQKSFENYDFFLETIMKEYKFGETIIIDGYPLMEYSTIEYVLMDKLFELKNYEEDPKEDPKKNYEVIPKENKFKNPMDNPIDNPIENPIENNYDEEFAKALAASLLDVPQPKEDDVLFEF